MKVTVLGAGQGGLATAGHISLKGHEVHLFSFYGGEIDPVTTNGGVKLEGEVDGFAKIAVATTNLEKAVKNADLIMVIMPALAHKNMASLLTGCIEDGQVLLLSPGRTGGALETYQTFRRYQLKKRVLLAECQTLLYAAQSRGPSHVEILKVKNKVRASALPATDNEAFMEVMSQIYPEYTAATNVFETSINSTGAVVHPAPMLMNSGLLERAANGEDLRYYRDVISEFVCDNVMEKIDKEISDIVRTLGLPVLDVLQWYKECYGIEGKDLYSVLQNNHYYFGVSAPEHVLADHHVLDEVPNSLVPIASFGSALGVPTPMTRVIVDLASAALGYDFWMEGRTLEKLGLKDMTPEEMLTFINRGTHFWEK